jgi:DNA (cytosine-5)-methyltransferase 1
VIKICSLFEEEGEKKLHGQWFQHAAKTILQEAEDPHALYLIDECDDVKLDSIHQKANVRTLSRDESIPQDPSSALFGERPENNFYHV